MLTLLRHPDLWSQPAAPATLSEVASAWGTLTALPTFKKMKKNRINSAVYRALSQGRAEPTASAAASTSTQTAAPKLANLGAAAAKQSQRAFAYAVLDDLRAKIVEDRRHLTLHSRVRIAACSRKGAGRFMIVLPAHKHSDLLLTPEQYMDNVHLRFGLGLSRRLHDEHTACGCGVRPSHFSCVQEFFDHVLGCKKGAKGTITQRHDLILPILGALVKEIGFEWDTSSQGCGFPSIVIPAVPNQGQGRLQGDKKLDGIAHWLADKAKTWGIDITVWHACADSHRQSEMAAMGPNAPAYVTRLAESAKHAKYGGLCTARGIQHLPAAFNTYGGWGEEILDKLVEPFFNRLRAEERAATGGTEWNTLAKREFLFQCTSVAIARGNTMILNTLRQSWQQQPSANTKRGKPHRATLKAGPWDEPPQLARALASGF